MPELNGPERSLGSDAIFPLGPYQGRFSLENLAFNANLQEFTLQANKIANAHGQGHIASDEALHQLEQLWQQLKASKHGLGIGSWEAWIYRKSIFVNLAVWYFSKVRQ